MVKTVNCRAVLVIVLGAFAVTVMVVDFLRDTSQVTEVGYDLIDLDTALAFAAATGLFSTSLFTARSDTSRFRAGGVLGSSLIGMKPADVLIVIVPPSGGTVVVVNSVIVSTTLVLFVATFVIS